jgi:predicted regulator of Ras-like GTPase activity (Roadblock/LC7/MglB family)
MNEVLEPLLRIPGVRVAALSTPDGVPIAWKGELENAEQSGSDALAGLVTGWVQALAPSLGLVSWDLPRRLVLRSSRGTLVVERTASAVLFVVVEPGTAVGDLRLPLEAALSRLQRVSRAPRALLSTPAALPQRNPKGLSVSLSDNGSDSSPGSLPA